MGLSAEFLRCLVDSDVSGLRRAWAHAAPHLPPIASDADALVVLHRARTEAMSVPFLMRAYSHRWLTERSFPSALPDELRPRAERMYPVVMESVGIAVKALSPGGVPRARAVRAAMENAVLEAYADGVTDPVKISARMQAARHSVRMN